MSDARDFFGYRSPDDEPAERRDATDEDGDRDADDVGRAVQFDEAITLDDAAVLQRIDPADMRARVAEMPTQLRTARRVGAAVELDAAHRAARRVLVLGMGGSAIGADLVAAAAGDRLRVPLTVHRDYGLPSWVDRDTLVVAASHSGDTAETLSGARAARERGVPLAVISTGGSLGDLAREARLPYLRYQAPGQPRAAIGYGVGLLHELLDSAGLVDGPDRLVDAADDVERLLGRIGPSIPTADNPAKALAWAIFGRVPVVYGAGSMAAVARRWKTQFNENAKAWAVAEQMPEANHNAIEGTLNPRELGESLYVVELRSSDEAPDIAARYQVVEELLGERATQRSVAWAEGSSALSRVLCSVAHGDMVSVYLGILYQTDPTPVTLLSMLKERLARMAE
ncbi:MAG: bifunctional phosphoglucose/phosphomannose isomerase [Chloroflexota bacterium]|nr:bifunctional phosphoglucose/phosphomannose isomerase [Chloroflexota bacterium]